METIDLVQGSPEWKAHRAKCRNASDAPAMLGASSYTSRTQLLHKMHSGVEQEVDAMTQRRFDAGHRFEALARPLAAEIIGEDLYPVVGVNGGYSASFDGLTMAEDVAFEHKTLNDSLRNMMHADIRGHELALQYRIQMEQQCLVSGCERVLFMASEWDGDNLIEERHCWYTPDLELRDKIVSGWEQFDKDLAAYVPQEAVVKPMAAPQAGLPAVSIQVNGSVALVDNLEKFGTALTAYIGRINKRPETDQDFADLEATVKTLKTAEDALDAAETNALAQTESIDAMRKTVALYRDTARTNRLLVEKLVKAEKENRRIKILGDAGAELQAHVRSLNGRARNLMPQITGQFNEAVKGLKSIDSMKDKVSVELARCKIEANSVADRIQYNLELLDDEVEFSHLFPDYAHIVLKAADDFKALVNSRISDHKVEVERKEAEMRERIRVEEQAKAEREAHAKFAAEQIAADKLAREHAQLEQDEIARLHKLNTTMVVEVAAPVSTVVHMPVRQAAPATVPSLKLGEISQRLGFTLTADFLKNLGFEPAATDKASKLFHESDFPLICMRLVSHIQAVQTKQAA